MGKKDLENFDFAENYKEIFQDIQYQIDESEIVTTLPIAYTYDVNRFNFGKVNFQNSDEGEIEFSKVGILFNNTSDTKTKGILIEVKDTPTSESLLNYLHSQYSSPKVLVETPKKNEEGQTLGNAAYVWNLPEKTILLVQFYEYNNGKPNISSVLYDVDNQAKTIGNQETVSSRLIRTYSP